MSTKQVIVLRKDLNMRKGKMVAQGAHASCNVIIDMENKIQLWDTHSKEEPYRKWKNEQFTKICVSVNSEQELLDLYNKAKDSGMLCSLIQDAGHTEFNGVPTYTSCAIGPDDSDVIDAITKHLPLL